MGYYVNITHSDFRIPAKNVQKAYKRLCDLNKYDDIKRGGSYGGDTDGRKPRPEGLDYHPGKWFSWMYPDYPNHCENLADIFQELGFQLIIEDDGSIILDNYDNKAGQEDIFLDEIIDLAEGEINWIGEDGQIYQTTAGCKKNILEQTRSIQNQISALRQEI
jgi:hypothetical protein